MNEELKKLLEQTQKSIEEMGANVATTVEEKVNEKVAELSAKSISDMDEIKKELGQIKLAGKQTEEVKDFAYKTAIVNIFKNIKKANVANEEQFKDFANAEIKAVFLNEGTAGEGAEQVFAQFETAVINVMKIYPVVNELHVYTTTGKDLSIPKITNNIETYWADEGDAYTPSKYASSFVKVDVYKATSMVKITEELRDDNMTTPDAFALIVRLTGESQGAFQEDAFLNGDGTKVDGLFHNASVKVVDANAGNTSLYLNTAEELDDLLCDADSAISMEFQTNPLGGVAVMSQYTFNVLKKAKNALGLYQFPELRDAKPMFGRFRVIKSHKAPVQNKAQDIAGATPIAFGDLSSYYGVVRRKGMTLVTGYATGGFESDVISVKANQRFGGKPTIPEAFSKIKNALV